MEERSSPANVTGTYAHQAGLSRLPIPPLEATLDRFLNRAVKSFLSEKEWEETRAAVEAFLRSGDGPAIYEALKGYEKAQNSYIETFWDAAYLEYDASVAINVNPVFVLESDPTPARSKLLPRAVSLIYSSLKFARAVRRGILTADKVKDTPLCMDQYRRLFGSARVPDPAGAEKDVIINSPDSTHIVIICRGQFYFFQALMRESFDVAITERELTKNLEAIINDAKQHEVKSAVGVLTSETRSRWRKLRKELCATSKRNQQIIEVIDTALFVVCLDVDYEPESVSDAAANILHGTSDKDASDGQVTGGTMTSRWYDKLMLIVTQGGVAGVNFEHSAFDGHTVLRFASDVFTDTIIRYAQTISGGIACLLDPSNPNQKVSRPDLKPRKLEFTLTPSLERSIRYAHSRMADAIHQNHTTTLEYNGYGKNFLVSNGLSPDATVQLAIQTTFFDLYGEPANTYESVLTKAFFRGRTEAGRSCTPEAVTFMRAFCGLNEASRERKIELLKAAASAHSKMTAEAGKGQGVDRLLYALECLWAEQRPNEPKPAIFSSPGWTKLNQSVLSTSNCGNASLRFFGFGPVCPQGFGIGYIIKEDAIHFMITSKRRQTDQFRRTLAKFFETIQDDLIAVAPHEPAPNISLIMFRSKGSVENFEDLVRAASPADGKTANRNTSSSPATLKATSSSKASAIAEDGEQGYDFFGLNLSRIGTELK